ncbi:MAG: hypothetical protein Ct9H300mP6_15440 [Gammaproteobacteria bacterium]|nr:MAG: hypothetical protein Ct9H300mP6_15440 [Gammaproteobacteria bacterium]
MSYLVLARKWRPNFFSEVSGQNHVVKALQNSLKQNKAHMFFYLPEPEVLAKQQLLDFLLNL